MAITSAMFEPMKPTISSSNQNWTNQNVTITVGNKSVPGVSYQYTTNGGSSWNDLSSTTFTINTNGDYTDKIKAKAILKNENKESPTTTAKYDNTPPTTSISGSGSWLYGTHTDNLSGVDGYVFTTSSAAANTFSYSTISATTSSTQQTTSVSAGSRYYFYVRDAAGNYSASKSGSWNGQCGQPIRSNAKAHISSSSYSKYYCAYCGKLTTTNQMYVACSAGHDPGPLYYFCSAHKQDYNMRYNCYSGSTDYQYCKLDKGWTYY